MRYLEQRNNLSVMMEQFIDGEVMDIPFIVAGDEDLDIGGIMAGQSVDDEQNEENIAA